MINCYIIDDEQHAIDLLIGYVQRTPFLKLVGSTTEALDAIKVISNEKVDLVFLDIHMPSISGIDLLKIFNNQTKVVLTTAYSEYAMDGYEHDVVDYLLKPITYQRFLKAAQKALNMFQTMYVSKGESNEKAEPEVDYLFVKSEHKGKQIKVNFNDIDYIEGLKNYVAFHCDKEKILALLKMKDLEQTLPPRQFARIHNSFIISLNRIVSVDGNQVILRKPDQQTVALPIGITFKQPFFDMIKLNK
jgi:DNA-binding LytR/AlgR family response regulator